MSVIKTAPPRTVLIRYWKLIVTSTLVVAGAVLLWEEVLEDRLTAKNLGTVVAGQVHRSGQISRWMIEPTLREHGIKVIVDLTAPLPDDAHQQAELATAEQLGVEHCRFPLAGDGTGRIENYVGAIQAIDRAVQNGDPVLVHCASGAQRTGGVVAAWRLLIRGDDPQAVRAEMLSYGAKPEVFDYLDANLPEIGNRLHESGTLSTRPARTAFRSAAQSF